jgi:hypothetical protein
VGLAGGNLADSVCSPLYSTYHKVVASRYCTRSSRTADVSGHRLLSMGQQSDHRPDAEGCTRYGSTGDPIRDKHRAVRNGILVRARFYVSTIATGLPVVDGGAPRVVVLQYSDEVVTERFDPTTKKTLSEFTVERLGDPSSPRLKYELLGPLSPGPLEKCCPPSKPVQP